MTLARVTRPAGRWKPVVGYEEAYDVCDDGAIWSRRGSGRLRKQIRSREGYMTVSLTAGGRSRTMSVHSVVMAAFVGPRPEGLQIRHLDGDPGNNALSNLAYGTAVENAADKVRHGTNVTAQGDVLCFKLTALDVQEIHRAWAAGVPKKTLARRYKVAPKSVREVLSGVTWRSEFDRARGLVAAPRVRVLTARQPWACAMMSPHAVAGVRDVENRSWSTPYRGDVAIHAGLTFGSRQDSPQWALAEQAYASAPGALTGRGAILGVARLADCHPSGPGCCDSPWGEVDAGFHLVFEDARPFEDPIGGVAGRSSLWEPEPVLAGLITAQLGLEVAS